MRDPSAAAVSITDLTKTYANGGNRPALDGIDMQIRHGETYGLLGPNGAGKTTTVAVCTTRTRPTSGRVKIAGWDVVHDATRVRRDIGVVTQFNTLDRSCSVADNLYFHCRYFGMSRKPAKARTGELLEDFQLTQRSGMRVAWLSGGMVQRLQIARAVAHRPRVLFLDEPTTGLDPQSRLSLWEQIRQLKHDGTTVFLTTHYMEEAEHLCDRLSIMDEGKVLVTGTPKELIRAHGGETVVHLSIARPGDEVERRLRGLTGVQSVERTAEGYRVATVASAACPPLVVQAATEAGIHGLSVQDPTLESVVLSLTGRNLRD